GDVGHDLHRALVEKVTRLLSDSAPSPRRIVAKKDADDREQDENKRRERENRVIGQGRTELGRFVVHPLGGRLFQELEGGAEKGFSISRHGNYLREIFGSGAVRRWIFFAARQGALGRARLCRAVRSLKLRAPRLVPGSTESRPTVFRTRAANRP